MTRRILYFYEVIAEVFSFMIFMWLDEYPPVFF